MKIMVGGWCIIKILYPFREPLENLETEQWAVCYHEAKIGIRRFTKFADVQKYSGQIIFCFDSLTGGRLEAYKNARHLAERISKQFDIPLSYKLK